MNKYQLSLQIEQPIAKACKSWSGCIESFPAERNPVLVAKQSCAAQEGQPVKFQVTQNGNLEERDRSNGSQNELTIVVIFVMQVSR